MSIWKKTLLMMVAAMTIGGGVSLAAGGAPSPATSTSVDVKGPCDEAEHANDPECAGPQIPEGDGVNDDDDPAGVDISGPCDEAEHANDPRCTGAAVPGDDNSGPGNGDDTQEDRSGPSENAGPGNADDDDNSGPGSGRDDDDSSGPGSGGDDNSGPGSGGDDG
jgi:hypothetical protein